MKAIPLVSPDQGMTANGVRVYGNQAMVHFETAGSVVYYLTTGTIQTSFAKPGVFHSQLL